MTTRLIALLVGTLMNASAGLSDLEALSLIESGANDRAVGTAGEVSRYQILPKVWKSYTVSSNYRSPWVAGEVARRHVYWLQESYARATGRLPSDFDLYVMWNAGFAYYSRMAFEPRRVHRLIRERANRFVNLKQYTGPVQATIASAPAWNRPTAGLLTPTVAQIQ